MSISDESFPEDEFINEKLDKNNFLYKNNNSSCGSEISPSITDPSSGSTKEKLHSPRNHPVFADIFKHNTKMRPKRKSNSWQDIHSEYSQRRYQHVKSKVKQYIAEIQAQDRRRNIGRHQSLPEALGSVIQIERNNEDNSKDELAVKLLHHDQEITELKTINESLHRNLQEKQLMVGKLQENIDTMRYELFQEREKSNCRMGILRNVCTPRRSFLSRYGVAKQTSVATQTIEINDSTDTSNSMFNSEEWNNRKATLNHDSNDDESSNNSYIIENLHNQNHHYDSTIETISPENVDLHRVKMQWLEEMQRQTKEKKTKIFKKRFRKYFLGACCIGTGRRGDLLGEYSYENIPLSDSSVSINDQINLAVLK